MSSPSDDRPGGRWGGYGSLSAQVAALRRARFEVFQSFEIGGRGPVLEGRVLVGEVKAGMVLLLTLEHFPNVVTPRTVLAVEEVLHSGGIERIGLVLEADVATSTPKLQLAPGTVVDVLDRAPAA